MVRIRGSWDATSGIHTRHILILWFHSTNSNCQAINGWGSILLVGLLFLCCCVLFLDCLESILGKDLRTNRGKSAKSWFARQFEEGDLTQKATQGQRGLEPFMCSVLLCWYSCAASWFTGNSQTRQCCWYDRCVSLWWFKHILSSCLFNVFLCHASILRL